MPKNSKIGILYFVSPLFFGGEHSLFAFLKNINKNKINPVIIANKEGPFIQKLREENFKCIILPVDSIRSLIIFLKSLQKIKNIIKTENISLIHLNRVNIFGFIAAKFFHLPCIIHYRTFHSLPRLDRLILKWCTKIIAVSNASKTQLVSYGIHENKIETLYNGININSFHIKDFIMLSPQRKKTVGFIGRITPYKGVLELVDAIPIILAKYKDVEFVFSGEFSEQNVTNNFLEILKLKIKKLNIEEEVFFTGYTKDIPNLLLSFDVLVLPSYNEGLPRVVLEAMAAGLPVVASKIGGTLEIVEDGVTGFLIDKISAEEIAEKILKILQSDELSQNMGKKGRQKIEKEFDIDFCVKKLESIYLNPF